MPATLIGKAFRLTSEALGIEEVGTNKERISPVPGGETIRVTGVNTHQNWGMVNVLWKGRQIALFAEDVKSRGEEVSSAPA